jgi:hypothetical protein
MPKLRNVVLRSRCRINCSQNFQSSPALRAQAKRPPNERTVQQTKTHSIPLCPAASIPRPPMVMFLEPSSDGLLSTLCNRHDFYSRVDAFVLPVFT